jgi:acyl carrier protein
MKKNEFVTKLSEYCEFGNNNYPLDTLFESIDEYDSLAVMTIIAFVDERFKMSLATDQLREITDFNSLIALIGEDKFEND